MFSLQNHATFDSPLVWCRMWISLVGSSKKQAGLVFKWCTVDRDRNSSRPGCLASFGETNQLKTCKCRFKRQKLASFDWVSFFCGLSSSWGESLYERFVPMVKLQNSHGKAPMRLNWNEVHCQLQANKFPTVWYLLVIRTSGALFWSWIT